MKAFLFILLGLSLGSGLTLIALQERFVRERRRLMALGESQRATATQAAVALLNKQWEQKCKQHTDELEECRTRLAETETSPPAVPEERGDVIDTSEHERMIHEKNLELGRLAAEIKTMGTLLTNHKDEINDLHGQITFLKGEIAKLEEEKKRIPAPDDDFLFLGQGRGHLLPGSVARAFIKGHQGGH